MTRRHLLRTLSGAGAVVGSAVLDPLRALAAVETLARHPATAAEAASDEDFWFEVQRAFTVDRTLVNLNNGGVSPSPAIVQESMRRYLEYSNSLPAYTMWQVLEPQREAVRERLAAAFGCEPGEMALTRNASEGLETCQLGLDLEAGDEVLTSTQDYGRMLTAFEQRGRRDGIVLKKIQLPVPAEDASAVVALYERSITAKTKLLLMCHVINLTGQVLPVKEVVAMARRHGVPVIVDGAHAFAHFPYRHADLDCDYYATSLHKWLFAPHGTGFLFVRKDKIRSLWPLMAAPEAMDADIRKFEEIGTHPAANYLAIGDALTFHQGLGAERKAARLVYLRDRWARRLTAHSKVKLHTSLRPGLACGLATVQILGVKTAELAEALWKKHRIFTVAILHPEFEGLRVTPSVYTTLEEVDRFARLMELAAEKGVEAL